MKAITRTYTAYERPRCKVIVINTQRLVCTSPAGLGNESYEDGDTSDWFNN